MATDTYQYEHHMLTQAQKDANDKKYYKHKIHNYLPLFFIQIA